MAFTNMLAPAVGSPTKKQSFADVIIANILYLYNLTLRLLSQDGIQNGSFETDVDTDGIPDAWTVTLTGGAFAVETTAANVAHGTKSIKFTSTGAGGGYIQYADFFEVSERRPFIISWQMKSSLATVSNKVEILFYDGAQSFLSTTVVYNNSTTNTTAWFAQAFPVTPPANAKFARLKITGADSATAGSTYYDDFRFVPQSGNVPIGKQIFTSGATTWTAPQNVVRVRAILIGGGGGGGGAQNPGTTAGGAGGRGGFIETFLTVSPGLGYTVTVGAKGNGGAANTSGTAGGTSSFGSLASATGGGAGAGGATTAGAAGTGTSSYANVTVATSNFFLAKGTGGAGGVSNGAGSNGVDGYIVLEW